MPTTALNLTNADSERTGSADANGNRQVLQQP